MRIYSMTATFGKLEHATLVFEPGLHVIHAPNEWGKSTWCAFLLNMLYGVDTKERSKQDTLADKDRYAPWSGAAMSGRIELNWNGRDITIERSSNARIPLGVFRAYETGTGIDVPELTAANCGQLLLGVERNVFTRAGFLRLSDMPVTQDDALRRRLNNLVTTGDESGAADKLGQTLKDLKNKCRSNKSNGLLPEAEAQRDLLRNQLWDLQELEQQAKDNLAQQQILERQLKALEIHQQALEYEASKENALRVAHAEAACSDAKQTLTELQTRCASLPDRQSIVDRLRLLEQLQLQLSALETETLPPVPEKPEAPAPFQDMDADQALQQASSDKAAYDVLCKKRSPLPVILALLSIAAGIAALFLVPLAAAPFSVIAAIFLIAHFRSKARQTRDRTAVAARYGQLHPEQWVALAVQYQSEQDRYEALLASYHALFDNHCARANAVAQSVTEATEGLPLTDSLQKWKDMLSLQDALLEAQRAYDQAARHAQALRDVAKPVQPPTLPDTLTLDKDQTRQAIAEARFAQQQLVQQLGNYQGQMETLGQSAAIKAKLDAVNQRISRLETYNNAIELAQNALYKATLALQRRFSPRITKRAQQLFARLTGDRYQRITMSEDMRLQTAAENEDTLRELRRRSEGTVDQLYLALRLAVAEELTPNAPLVLDDALARFDDKRLAAAMDILQETAESKQVILFSCHSREQAYIKKNN